LLLVVKTVPESRASDRMRPLNAVALSAWIAGVCAIISAVVLGGSAGWTSPLVWGTLAAGGVTLLALTWLERHPIKRTWRFILRFERRLSIAILAGVLLNLALYAAAVQIFNFLTRVQGYDLIHALLGLVPILLGALLLGTLAARLTIRLGLRDALSVGLLMVAAAAGGFGLLQPDIPYWALAPLLVLLGLGFIAGNSPYLLLLGSSVPLDLSATIQAVGRTTSQLGGALAYALMLALISGFGGKAYVEQVKSTAISLAEATEEVSSLAAAAGDTSLVLASEAEIRALDLIAPGFKLAYTVGLSRAMWVLAGMCLFGAAIVHFGLRSDRDKER
jgi:DHA2 family methylenomycin A resistance protein-like MFS transporter